MDEKGQRARLGRVVLGNVVPGWLLIVFVLAVVPPQQQRNGLLIASAGAFWLAAILFADYVIDAFSLAGWIDELLAHVDWLRWQLPLALMVAFAVLAWRFW